MKQPGYYAIIPAPVRYDKELSSSQKLLFGEITVLSNKYGYCIASNNYFADLYDVDPSTVSKWISGLKSKGYVRIEYQKKGKQIVERRVTPLMDHKGIEINQGVLKKDQEGTEKRSKGYCKNPRENSTSQNNTSQNNTRDLDSFDYSDFEDEPLKALTLKCYWDIKKEYTGFKAVREATLDSWYQHISEIAEDYSLEAEKLAGIWNWAFDDWWRDKLTSTANFKKHFESIFAQYKRHKEEILDNDKRRILDDPYRPAANAYKSIN